MNATRRFVSVMLACVAITGFVGCAPSDPLPSDSSSATRTASATVTSSPSPSATTSPSTRPATVVVTTTSLLVLDQSGATLGEIPFSLAGPDAATELTRVFGVTPAESESEGGLEVWPAHIYDWSGFELHDELRDGTKPGPYYEYFVWVKTPSVNGIEVRTTGGVHVGDSGASVVYDASSPWPPSSWGNQTCGVEALYSESGDIYDSVGLYVCSAIDTDQVIFFVVPQQLQV